MDENIVWHNYAISKSQRSEQKNISQPFYGSLAFQVQAKAQLLTR